MSRRWKLAVIILGSVVALGGVVLAPAVVIDLASSDLCGNEQLAEYRSPDGTMKVVVFERDCGATTDFSTQASLLLATRDLPAESGNLFIADTNHGAAPAGSGGGPTLGVRWEGPHGLVLEYNGQARIFKAEKNLSSVFIRYTVVR